MKVTSQSIVLRTDAVSESQELYRARQRNPTCESSEQYANKHDRSGQHAHVNTHAHVHTHARPKCVYRLLALGSIDKQERVYKRTVEGAYDEFVCVKCLRGRFRSVPNGLCGSQRIRKRFFPLGATPVHIDGPTHTHTMFTCRHAHTYFTTTRMGICTHTRTHGCAHTRTHTHMLSTQ